MKFTQCALFFVLALTADATLQRSTVGTNPIQKVLQLLNELQSKVTEDGEAEQKQYEEFSEWCKDEAVATQYTIKDGKAKSESLSAAIEKLSSDIATATANIETLASKSSTDANDLKAATAIREKENADYEKADAELAETIDMLTRAHGIIEKNMKATGFMQTSDTQSLTELLSTVLNGFVFSTQDTQKLQSLIQAPESDDDDLLLQGVGAPEPAAYKSHSGAILETLEDMADKAKKMRSDGQKAEMTAQHNFELLQQSLETAVAQAEKEMAAAKKAKAAAEEAKAEAEGDLATTNKALAESEKSLEDLSIDCQEKATAWEESQKSRAAELEALVSAQKVIKEMTGGAEAQAYGLLQVSSSSASRSSIEVVSMLQSYAKKTGDVAMTQLAQRVKNTIAMSSGDVFGKVKAMISDMLDKLMKEAQAEASHKEFCDKEMGESEAKMSDHNSKLDTMNARLDKATATKAKLQDNIVTLESELGELAKSQATMDQMRAEQKAEFEKVSKDLQDGVDGLTMALDVLQKYYAEKESEESLLQQPAVSTHSKASGEATGIIGLLEVALSDFTKNLAEERVTEAAAQEEYEKLSQENAITKATKETQLTSSKKEVSSLAKRIDEISSDKATEQAELDAVTEYYDSLKPQCIAKPETYAERKKRRESEIAGLKEALSILESTADTSFLAIRREGSS